MYKLNINEYGTHQIVARELSDENCKVLDVGCNEGYIKALSPKSCEFIGVDFDDDALKEARAQGYSRTFNVNLNDYPYKVAIGEKFDSVLFIDVLEHLLRPLETIDYFNHYLKTDGRVIISLPNVANIFVRLSLLFGNFNYTESGILDKTHLHLFTRGSAKKLIRESELIIIKETYSSNHFGHLLSYFPFLGGLLGFNLIYVCKKEPGNG